jgi:hypothetical protein
MLDEATEAKAEERKESTPIRSSVKKYTGNQSRKAKQ